MSKRKTPKKINNIVPSLSTIETLDTIEVFENAVLKNGLGEALGYLNPYNPFGGQAGFPGGFTGQQVEDSATIFENLRWYMVSNYRQMLSQAFVEIGLIQTICCVPVSDALRGGILIKSKQLDEENIKTLSISVDRDNDLAVAGQALNWDRLYGGAGILTLVGDQDPEEPLNIKKINKNTDLEFRAVDMWELFWDKQNTEGYNPVDTLDDEFEWYNYYSENVHRSRVMRLTGLSAPSFVRPRLRGWGMSEVERLVRSINQYLKATDLGFEVLDEFKIDVYKIKNLVTTLLSPDGTNKVKKRIQMANWQKNYQNAVVMDSEDEWDHKQLSFAGLAEAMEGIRMQVAADMRMPILKLFGTSVSKGMGTTSQDEMENYNSMVESEVRNKIKYHLLRMLEIKCQKLFGFIPDDLEIEFKPLRELTAVDQETVKTQKYERLDKAIQSGRITDEEYRDACNKGNLFDVQLDTTASALKEIEQQQIDTSDDADSAGEGDSRDPYKTSDSDDPGADRTDSRKVKLQTEHVRASEEKDKNKNARFIRPYGLEEKARRIRNSVEFDKASYEADGGDSWIADGRRELFENPGNVDEQLWAKAKTASQKAFGKTNWKFITWWYKKQGGKFE